VKVILLDTRYNRDAVYSDGDMLGEPQWQWLEEQLRSSDAQIHVIGSSVQVGADHNPSLDRSEESY
jgi:alkaline phosphatase D